MPRGGAVTSANASYRVAMAAIAAQPMSACVNAFVSRALPDVITIQWCCRIVQRATAVPAERTRRPRIRPVAIAYPRGDANNHCTPLPGGKPCVMRWRS
jgi:hypothetical protein